MGVLAYIEPKLVLPLVVSRLDEALETVTATHQLVAAMDALAACVRPLLLHPGALGDVPMDAMLAQALMATLPGIDANDPPKTLATLKVRRESEECGERRVRRAKSAESKECGERRVRRAKSVESEECGKRNRGTAK
eukprot:8651209-Pyramimonas_sp.AAC.1